MDFDSLGQRKRFAGARLRRLRQQLGLSQTGMAASLGVSVSYLHLLERNQRPLTANVLLRLAAAHDVDVRALVDEGADTAVDELSALAAREIGPGAVARAELIDFVDAHPRLAELLVRLGRRPASSSAELTDPAFVQAWLAERGAHLPELDSHAEGVADELRLSGPPLEAALARRLREKHGQVARIAPVELMRGELVRFDLHARQLFLSETLDHASRSMAIGRQLARLEAKECIEGELDGLAGARRALGEHMLASYWAAAVMMPYRRFHDAAEALGYDLELLGQRFGAGFEQVAHRLTTLGRPGARGVPMGLVRLDRAGLVSKAMGLVRGPIGDQGETCPLWIAHQAFERPGELLVQHAEMPSGPPIVTLARSVRPLATPWGMPRPRFSVALVIEAAHAEPVVPALASLASPPVAIGPGCRLCVRADCPQRSRPPDDAVLVVEPDRRGPLPYSFSFQSRESA